MSGQNESAADGSFMINWLLMNVAGLVIGMTLRQFVFQLAFGLVGGGLMGKAVEGAVIGTVIGAGQFYALPSQIHRSKGWIIASAIGWAVGWSLGWRTAWQLFGGFSTVFGIVGAMSGIFTGVFQWLILRRQLSQAGWWILAPTIAWGVGLAAAMEIRGVFGWVLAGGIGGAVTGALLFWLLRRSPIADNIQSKPSSDFSGG